MLIGEYVFVVGGAVPTSLFNKTADYLSNNTIRIYALNLSTMIWSNPIPVENTESLNIPLQIAESDIIRAKKRIQSEKDTAKSLGARRNQTIELVEAEAILKVCEWRKNKLLQEQNELIPSPENCFGVTFERIGILFSSNIIF